MVTLRIPPLTRLQKLRRNLLTLPPLFLRLLRHLLGRLLLLRRMIKYRASVLGACVGALSIFGGGIVHLVEELEEGGVGETGRVERHLEGFGVSRPSGANGAITRVVAIATDIPNSCIVESLVAKVLPEKMFHAPEAAGSDGAFLRGVGDILSATFSGAKTHLCGGGEGAEEAGHEIGH